MLAIEPCHGVTFACAWCAIIEFAATHAPKGLEATTQGVFSGVFNGFGSALGAIVGGWLYEVYGPRLMFRVAAALLTISWCGHISMRDSWFIEQFFVMRDVCLSELCLHIISASCFGLARKNESIGWCNAVGQARRRKATTKVNPLKRPRPRVNQVCIFTAVIADTCLSVDLVPSHMSIVFMRLLRGFSSLTRRTRGDVIRFSAPVIAASHRRASL